MEFFEPAVMQNILPYKKTKPADYHKQHSCNCHNRITRIRGQTGFISHQVKTRIAKSGNRMKNTDAQAPYQPIFREKTNPKDDSPQTLENEHPNQNMGDQPDNALSVFQAHGLHNQQPLRQIDFPVHNKVEYRSDRHEAQSANLEQA